MAKLARKDKPSTRRDVRCYLCGHVFEVSTKTMSTPCPKCNRALKVEDIVIKSYLPVNDVQTCGKIRVTPKGRIAAKRVQSGEGIECEGTIEGAIETEGTTHLGAKASWRGPALQSRTLTIKEGAKINGMLNVPWSRESS